MLLDSASVRRVSGASARHQCQGNQMCRLRGLQSIQHADQQVNRREDEIRGREANNGKLSHTKPFAAIRFAYNSTVQTGTQKRGFTAPLPA
jgi:hypothetical protein